MKAQINYAPATQTHNKVRCEVSNVAPYTSYSQWQTVASGSTIAPITMSAGYVGKVRLISVNEATGTESAPSAPIDISYDAAVAALTPPPTLDPPSAVSVTYTV